MVRPGDRLSAEEALRHPWLQGAQYLQNRNLALRLEYILKPGLNFPQPSDQKFPETILFNNASPLMKMNRFPARKESPVLDTARMRSWLARRR